VATGATQIQSGDTVRQVAEPPYLLILSITFAAISFFR
jgi:hypothetical protein